MRTIETIVYTFRELSDESKENAREWARNISDLYAWSEDSKASIEAFIDYFGAKLKDWCIGPWLPLDYKIEYDNANFRGRKLREFNPDYMPTGYCLDCALWQTFHAEFKRTGNAKGAFDSAVHEGFKEWRQDWEYAYSDESIDDFLIANEYEFTVEGKRA